MVVAGFWSWLCCLCSLWTGLSCAKTWRNREWVLASSGSSYRDELSRSYLFGLSWTPSKTLFILCCSAIDRPGVER
jgi:hypothetical protein